MRIPTIDCVTGQGGEYFEQLKRRSQLDMREERERVCEIIEAVRNRGEAALLEYEARFDRVELTSETLEVTEAEIQAAYRQVGDEWLACLRQAIASIQDFHERQKKQSWMNAEPGRVVAVSYTHLDVYKRQVDDNPAKQGMRLHNIPVLGGSDAISALVEQYSIQEIVIAIPSAAQNELNRILDECRKTNCKTRIMPYIHKFQKPDGLLPMIRDVNISDLLGRDEVVLDTEAISGYLHDKVVLVTGGGGSIGSELCRQIVNFQPKLLIILDIYENNAYDLQMELGMEYGLKEDKVKVLIGSVRDREMLRRLFERYHPEVVLHAAAHKHVPLMEGSPLEALKNNVFGTYNVASMAAAYKVRRFVLISTDKAVNPTNVMGASKRLAEMVVQGMRYGSQTEFVAVRFGNVLGSNGSVLPLFKRQIEHGGPVTVTHPDITRFFMTIPEAARLVLQAGAMAKGGEIFILDMGQPVRIADMARDMIRLSGFEPDRDIKIKYVGLRPGEKLYEELMLAEEGTCSVSYTHLDVYKRQMQHIVGPVLPADIGQDDRVELQAL